MSESRRSLPPELRRSELLSFLRANEGATVSELARVHGVSSMTIHRDLSRLALEGLIERIHGGARIRDDAFEVTPWVRRLTQHRPEKQAIAATAAELVEPGSTIFVDSSTTCLAFAEELARQRSLDLAIVTNSPAILSRLEAPSIHVVVTPGELNQELRLVAGSWTVEFLTELKFRMAFVSGSGINTEQGLGSMTRPLADALKVACSVADQTVALVDSSKFDRAVLATISSLDRLDLVVTDDRLSTTLREEYERAGATLRIARSSGPEPLGEEEVTL